MSLVDYLANGALINILHANGGGKSQPHVWIINDTGAYRYTFRHVQGAVGGELVPFGATEGNRIFLDMRDEVLRYLLTFGLSNNEASEIIRRVGTEPDGENDGNRFARE